MGAMSGPRETETAADPAPRWRLALSRLSASGTALVHSRAAWAYALIWVLSAIVLTLRRGEFPFGVLLPVAVVLAISMVTIALTDPPSNPGPPPSGGDSARSTIQVAIVLAVIVWAGWRGLVFHGVIPLSTVPTFLALPTWDLGTVLFGEGREHWLDSMLIYTAIPLLLLLLAGARPRELGLRWGDGTGRVLAGVAVPLLAFGLFTANPAVLGQRLISNAFQNGPFEEFLFRGALQTRLRSFISADSALVVQALLFGVWHIGLGLTMTGGDVLAAVAYTIVFQSLLGIGLGVVFARTWSLIAPSILHVLMNSVG